MAMLKWCVALVALLGMIRGYYAVPKKCINTPFDLVFASEDTARVIPSSVEEINRVLKAIAAQLDIGGQHRIGYITMTTNAVITNFDRNDHTTLASLNTAIDAVMDQSAIQGNAQIAQGVDQIRTQFSSNQRPNVAKLGLVLDASPFSSLALDTASATNAAAGIIMYAIGLGKPFSSTDRAVSSIVQHPPNERYKRALTLRDFNFFRDDVLENPIIRLLCPGDIGGRCGRDTLCDKAANTVCVQGNCKCNPGLQNTNGVCVTGGVLGESCKTGECSVHNSECVLGVCACIERFTPIGTTFCKGNQDDGDIDPGLRV
ncbi:uncharacterized protein LOC110460138, partial [Mizuhopecten yessoensis]|uniref:uncharacterized protein LOC110460138 n=1 Tax=Mizuhopecten yessoensis TaxID=6573 RepID=UPI000B45F5C7